MGMHIFLVLQVKKPRFFAILLPESCYYHQSKESDFHVFSQAWHVVGR